MKTKSILVFILIISFLASCDSSGLRECDNPSSTTAKQVNGNATHITSASCKLNVGEWSYIVITKDSNNGGKLYKNGQLVFSGSWLNLPYNWNRIDLGAVYYTSWARWFNGQIDELRISNIVRSESEISSYYNSNSVFQNDSNTIGLWHFDETSGSSYSSEIGVAGVGYNTTSVLGKFGRAISFDGVSSRAQISQSVPTSNVTLEFWIKPVDITSEVWAISFYGMNTAGFTVY